MEVYKGRTLLKTSYLNEGLRFILTEGMPSLSSTMLAFGMWVVPGSESFCLLAGCATHLALNF